MRPDAPFPPPAVSIQYRMAAVKAWFHRKFPATCALGRFFFGRKMRRVELTIALCLLALIVTIQIRGWLFERQVRSIVGHFRQIQLEKTPAEVAFRLRQQYRPFLYEPFPNRPAPCSLQHCRFTLKFEEYGSTIYLLRYHPWTRFPLDAAFRLLGPLGLRYNSMSASLQADDGVISGMWLEVALGYFEHGAYFTTLGNVRTVRNFGLGGPNYDLVAAHPNYMVIKPSRCTGCTAYLVSLTPAASREEWQRALGFNFPCMRKFGPCKMPEQLMPDVARQVHLDSMRPPKPVADMKNCDIAAIRLMARDADTVALVEVKSVGPPMQPWQYVAYKPIMILKSPGNPRYLPIWSHIGYLVDRPTHQRDPRTGQLSRELFHVGEIRLALFLPLDRLQVECNCAVMPVSPAYLNAARQGIAADRPNLPRR